LEVARCSPNDPKGVSDAQGLVIALENFEFLWGLVIWHDILFFINMVSKKLQSKIVCTDVALEQIEGVISYFKKYRNKGFNRSIDIAKEFQKRWMWSQYFINLVKVKERNILMNKMKKKHYQL
jgi:hypothetical protein